MYPILYSLILIFILFVFGLIFKSKRKIIDLISSFGWLVLIWGFLGETIQLYNIFESIQIQNSLSAAGLIFGGLKISLNSVIFGLAVFLVARLEMIILIVIKKEH